MENEEQLWWMEYAEGNWIGLSNVPKIIKEAEHRRTEEIREFVEGLRMETDPSFTNAFREDANSMVRGIIRFLDALLDKLEAMQ